MMSILPKNNPNSEYNIWGIFTSKQNKIIPITTTNKNTGQTSKQVINLNGKITIMNQTKVNLTCKGENTL